MANPSLAADYQGLIILTENTYQTLVDAGKWLAMPPEDTVLMMLHGKLDKLMQHQVPSAQQIKKKLTCFFCVQEEHFARNCP